MTPDASKSAIAPWLVLAVGNPSRGDDALGPELIERLSQSTFAESDVEFLVDFQLQIEHSLDLTGRRAVLFVDAAHPGVVSSNRSASTFADPDKDYLAGAEITPISADVSVTPASHALSAEAVLHVAQQLEGTVPPAWQLAIEGQSFDLGEGLSDRAEHHLTKALTLAQQWLDARRCEALSSP